MQEMQEKRDIILKTENLRFSYDDGESYSLDGLSVDIKKGKKIAVMGANGAGKSTFFLCCNGIHRPSSGIIYFDGAPVDYSRKGLLDLRGKVGIVFQDPDSQLFSASVYQEISFGILNQGVDEKIARAKVERVMEELEITPFAQKPTHALSGGQKKQVSIADILVMEPQLMILDEPTAALDPKHTAQVNHLVDELTSRGITVMLSTHDTDYAFGWADEILLLHQGKLLKQGTPLEIFSDLPLLAETNLTQPAVMQVFVALKNRGIFDENARCPASMSMLIDELKQI